MSDIVGTPTNFRDELVAVLPRLTSFACRLTGSRDDGADLVQSACQRALEASHQWRPDARLDSWMYRIIQNLWIDRLRRQKVRCLAEPEEPDWRVLDGRSAADSWLMLQKVRGAVDELPREQRDVLELIAVQGCSYKEAARQLELPIGTVMSRLARARDRLKTQVGWPLAAVLLALALGAKLPEEAQAASRVDQRLGRGVDRGADRGSDRGADRGQGADRGPERPGTEPHAGLASWAKILFAMAYILIALDDEQLQALAAESEAWHDLPDLLRAVGEPESGDDRIDAEIAASAAGGPVPDQPPVGTGGPPADAEAAGTITVAPWLNLDTLTGAARAGPAAEPGAEARAIVSAEPGGAASSAIAKGGSQSAPVTREQASSTGPATGAEASGLAVDGESGSVAAGLGAEPLGPGSVGTGSVGTGSVGGRGYGIGLATAIHPAALIGSADDDQLVGSAGKDWIRGLEGSVTLTGGAESDVLEGGDGGDLLIGGAGADALYGGPGDDLIIGDEASLSSLGQPPPDLSGDEPEAVTLAAPVETPGTPPVEGNSEPPAPPAMPAAAGGADGSHPVPRAAALSEQASAQAAAHAPLSGAEAPGGTDGPGETVGQDSLHPAAHEPAAKLGQAGPPAEPTGATEPPAQTGDQGAAGEGGEGQRAGPQALETPAVGPIVEDANADPADRWDDPYQLLFTIGGDDFLFGGWGNDRMFGGRDVDWLFGGRGNDRLYGGSHGDVLFGGTQDDRLWGGAGDDLLFGGSGDDKACYSGRLADYQVVGESPHDLMITDLRGGARDGSDRLVDIERVRFEDGTYTTRDLAEAYRTALQAEAVHARNGAGAPIGEDELVDAEPEIPLPGDAATGITAAGEQPPATSPISVENPLGPSLDDGSATVQVM